MKLLWLDLETSGLDPTRHDILEIAFKMEGIAQFERVVHVTDFDEMDFEAAKMHKGTGLLSDCLMSKHSIDDVRIAVDTAVRRCPDHTIHLAGNSVHFDRDFIRVNFKTLHARLHYRHLDVSVFQLRDIAKGVEPFNPPKVHRAMPDVERSIAIWEHYR